MAQNRPLTGAAQNFFAQFNRAQALQLAASQEEQRRQALLDAAELKRQQSIQDREDLALNIEDALGIFGDNGGGAAQQAAATDGITEETILADGSLAPDASLAPERRAGGRDGAFVFTQKQRQAFARSVAINPSSSGPILNFLSKANEFDLQQQKNTSARNLRGALLVQGEKTPLGKQQAITKLVQSGLYGQQEVQELINISNNLTTNPDLADLSLRKMVLDSTDQETLIDEEVKKRQEARTLQTTIGQEGRAEQRDIRKEVRARTTQIGQEARAEQRDIRKEVRTEAADIRKEERTPLSKLGKLISDKERLLKTTGPRGKQVQALDDAIIAEAGLGFKVPTGFQLADPKDPTKGVIPIKGGPKDNLTGENAAKAQMLRTALKAFQGNEAKGLPSVRELVFTKDSKGEIIGLNDVTLFNANFSIPFTDIRGVPFTKGDRLRTQMEFGIQAVTRSETGAAMPPEEVENTRSRFMPKVTDLVKTATLKLDMFEAFLKGTLQLIDPTGRFNEARFNQELVARGGEPTTTQPQQKVRVKF